MTTPLRLLQLEDNPVDAELIVSTLNEGGIPCEAKRVDRRDAYISTLKDGQIDVILADYSLPGFDGITALALARQLRPDIPFIFVSGTLGEELAIDAMHRGATDYILKQRLGRLIPSLQRAIREIQERQERARVEEALRQSEKQLRQSQKMEAVGRLAGGLAHDFNNLLTVIMGHAQVLLGEMPADHPLRNKIEEMQKAGDRAATLIRQLLTFSRKQPSAPKVLSLNPIVTNFETMVRRLIGEDLDLTIKLAPQDLRIKADPASPLTTFLTGQPMLMSMIAAPRCSLSFAASALTTLGAGAGKKRSAMKFHPIRISTDSKMAVIRLRLSSTRMALSSSQMSGAVAVRAPGHGRGHPMGGSAIAALSPANHPSSLHSATAP